MSQSPYIIDVDQQNIHEVIKKSTQVPVLLDFWAEWCQPCKALAPVLAKLAEEYKGRFILAKVDTDANPMLSQQLGVRSIPSLKLVVQGQLAGELNGAQPEGEIRRLLEPFLAPPLEEEPAEEEGDAFIAQVERARRLGAHDKAIDALQSAIMEQPDRVELQVLMADVLMDVERLDDTQQVLDNVKDEKLKASALGRLFFLRELQGFETAESLQYRVAMNADDMEARYYLAANCVLAGEPEAGMELLLEIIRRDRAFKNDGARTALLKVFDMLGADPRVATYRRRLFASLH
ncbi:MAG: tetratricopeptide repeat protein [Gammaproteobacteria bacterium]|nr:tetratricopeptide repeat protein [Gammaproteobacteria bacterium]